MIRICLKNVGVREMWVRWSVITQIETGRYDQQYNAQSPHCRAFIEGEWYTLDGSDEQLVAKIEMAMRAEAQA